MRGVRILQQVGYTYCDIHTKQSFKAMKFQLKLAKHTNELNTMKSTIFSLNKQTTTTTIIAKIITGARSKLYNNSLYSDDI